jgi:3D (Asp-Asp-Asp) domain-containing protein
VYLDGFQIIIQMTRFILSVVTVIAAAWTMSAQAAQTSKGAAWQAPSRTSDLATDSKALAHAAKTTAVAASKAAIRATKNLTSTMKQELAKASVKAKSVAEAGGNALGQHLARLTAYWSGEGDYYTRHHISATGVRLHNGHCAVDPSVIPYGSVVDIEGLGRYLAVDTGTAVVTRRAARKSGHNRGERSALVVDLYFENRREGEKFAANGPKFAAVTWWTPDSGNAASAEPVASIRSLMASNEAPRSKAL